MSEVFISIVPDIFKKNLLFVVMPSIHLHMRKAYLVCTLTKIVWTTIGISLVSRVCKYS